MSLPVDRVRALPFFPLHDPAETLPDGRPVHRLNLNESPLPPAPLVIAAMTRAALKAHHYPDGEASALIAALAARYDWPEDRVFVGAGSNELLAASAEIALDPGDEMIAPLPAFPTYQKLAGLRGARFVGVDVDDAGRIDVAAMLAAVTPRTRLMFVSSPHNPTGAVMTSDEIRHLVAALPDHVMLHFDEAYFEFGQAGGAGPTLPLLQARRGHWIATRTFSKAHALAGARVGYGFAGTPELAQAIRKVRANFSLSCVALAAGIAALEAEEYSSTLIAHLLSERVRIAEALAPAGFVPLDGAANFLALLPPEQAGDAAGWLPALAARGILITDFSMAGCRALRLTIGTREDSDAVIAALLELAASTAATGA